MERFCADRARSASSCETAPMNSSRSLRSASDDAPSRTSMLLAGPFSYACRARASSRALMLSYCA
jgi:hypothetical protein